MTNALHIGRVRVVAIGAALSAMFLTLFVSASAYAAPSPLTGVDYQVDLVDKVKSEITLAIVAGLVLLALLMAFRAGIRLVKGFGK